MSEESGDKRVRVTWSISEDLDREVREFSEKHEMGGPGEAAERLIRVGFSRLGALAKHEKKKAKTRKEVEKAAKERAAKRAERKASVAKKSKAKKREAATPAESEGSK